MSEKQPEIPPTVIQDPAMAEEMAYGEKPHRELSKQAEKLGLLDEATGQLDKAYVKGVEAGKRYLGEKQESINEQQTGVDTSRSQLEAGSGADSKEKPETKSEAQEAWEQSLEKLSPEQKEQATKLRSEITKHFEKFGMEETDLRILETKDEHDNPTYTLTHTGQGIDIGNPKEDYDPARSYDAIMSKDNDKLFNIEIDGKTYYTREGMTESLYKAKYQDAKDRGVTLPDSKQLSEETGDLHTWTMLTGEPLTAGGNVGVRYVRDGDVGRDVSYPGDDARDLRVCPAVVIK